MPYIHGGSTLLFLYRLDQIVNSKTLHLNKKHHEKQNTLKAHKFIQEPLHLYKTIEVVPAECFPKAHSQVEIQLKHCVPHIFSKLIQSIISSTLYLHNLYEHTLLFSYYKINQSTLHLSLANG
jgi:hypothetical protein